jgi:maltose alpha-D-glucosyltransferase/alpha-amylase
VAGKRRPPRPGPAADGDALVARVASALAVQLPAQRWFGGRTRRLTAVTPRDYTPVAGTEGVLALFDVAYEDGGSETYCVPALPGTDGAAFRDAMEDGAFCLALLADVREGGERPGRQGVFRLAPEDALATLAPEPPRSARRLGVEQSSTTVVFDNRVLLKLYRRPERGPSPELELAAFLTREAAFPGTPRLAGAILYEVPGEPPATVALLQEFVTSQGDAWRGALDRLAEYYAAVAEGPGHDPPDPVFARALATADAREAGRLGAFTGRLHAALAGASEASLAPEPVGAADVGAWHEAMRAEVGGALRAIEGALPTFTGRAMEAARRVLADAPRLLAELDAVDALAGAGITKIRVHGDYHLGQLLRTTEGFTVLDFEGEPARPLAERRAKQCALKDVAGMLRSFSYAAQAALTAAVEGRPGDARAAERLRPWAQSWEEQVRAAFVEGYLAETVGRGAPFLPRDREMLDRALRAFEVEKAAYEVRYELQHRPAWLHIPLAALEREVLGAPAVAGRLQPGEGPFTFVACVELREFVGVRAEDERQLAELLDEVPLDSVYYHTHGFLLRHKFLAGAYPNDFANWVDVHVRDRILGERLAMVDPGDFATLQALREELVAVIDEHLRGLPLVPRVVSGEAFDFLQSRIVEIPTGIEVRALGELREALLEIDLSALYYHLVEARLRLGRGRNDFAAWIERGLGLPALATRVQAVSPYAGSLEQARARLIALCDQALAEGTGT